MIVLLNPNAGGGTAASKWESIESRVRALVGPFDLVAAPYADTVKHKVRKALQNGETEFIAAGGDGTVNLVMTAILENAPRGIVEKVKLGAVGLGSSNDFHKPLDKSRMIDGIPFKLDFVATIAHDICLLTYRNGDGTLSNRRWLINAQMLGDSLAGRADCIGRPARWLVH